MFVFSSDMAAAPRDGTIVVIRTAHGDCLARFIDCSWLRETDAAIADCWRCTDIDDSDIELHEALAWAQAEPHQE